MMMPYRDRKNIPRRLKWYNQAHSATRVLVWHSNGRSENTWKRLKHLDVGSGHKDRVTISRIVLHHYMLQVDYGSDRDDEGRAMAN